MYYAELGVRPPPPGRDAPDPSAKSTGRVRQPDPLRLADRVAPYALLDDGDLRPAELHTRLRTEGTRDRVLAAVSADMRAAKLRGEAFDRAWPRALKAARPADGWLKALRGTRAAWELAYSDEPDPAERALGHLQHLLALVDA